jgi:hypothetical protein
MIRIREVIESSEIEDLCVTVNINAKSLTENMEFKDGHVYYYNDGVAIDVTDSVDVEFPLMNSRPRRRVKLG